MRVSITSRVRCKFYIHWALRLLPVALTGCQSGCQPFADVATYHYDNLRTGWDKGENTLTPANVGGLSNQGTQSFQLLYQFAVDEQVDAQPLYVFAQDFGSQGLHDAVYVATENNTVYAVEAQKGTKLAERNLGAPVPISALPGGCNNNSNNIGINSTPVIDLKARTLFVMANVFTNNASQFYLHALDLATLQDKVPPVAVGGGNMLDNGHAEPFVSAHNRQRAALLETGGNVYAGFASWCDINSNVSRGWVLGWNAATLAPLPANELVNQRGSSTKNFFLSSVWMSGYGLASDDKGDVFFVTGNSDPAGDSYDSKINLDESVVNLSADLTKVQGFFTPKDGQFGWSNLDKGDTDFGSAGVMLLPDQAGATPHLAVAAGKAGPLYLLNRDNLGGLTDASGVLGAYPNAANTGPGANDGCWCGPSFYVGSDGVGRVVESGGENVNVWRVQTSPAPALVLESTSPPLATSAAHDPGFFTTVSSSGTQANTAIIWAVSRPTNDKPDDLYLQAFDPSNGSKNIFSELAGTWPSGNANPNVVPVVGNGFVYVASYKNLAIFGLGPVPKQKMAINRPQARLAEILPAGTKHSVHGKVVAVQGTAVTLQDRTGKTITLDVSAGQAAHMAVPIVAGEAIRASGDFAADGKFMASVVLRAKPGAALWGPDQ